MILSVGEILADIIKFSEDEITLYTDIEDTLTAVKSLAKPNQLFVVTLGKDGSMYYNGAQTTQFYRAFGLKE